MAIVNMMGWHSYYYVIWHTYGESGIILNGTDLISKPYKEIGFFLKKEIRHRGGGCFDCF